MKRELRALAFAVKFVPKLSTATLVWLCYLIAGELDSRKQMGLQATFNTALLNQLQLAQNTQQQMLKMQQGGGIGLGSLLGGLLG